MSVTFSTDGDWQKFGWRSRNGGEWHYGRDYGTKGQKDVPLGVPKYCDGWVCHPIKNNKIDGMGNQVVLVRPDGKEFVRFAHIESGSFKHLKAGQIMHYGDWIGDIGGSGKKETSYQPHIHVEHGLYPKYELIEMKVGKKAYRYKDWYSGDQRIEDYKDPNLKALPFHELEELTTRAFQSKALVQAGKEQKIAMSKVHPTLLPSNEGKGDSQPQEEGGFVAWFRSTWIGRLFYTNETDNNHTPKERTGPIIHRKELIPTSFYQGTQEGKEAQNGQKTGSFKGASKTLSASGQVVESKTTPMPQVKKSKEMG